VEIIGAMISKLFLTHECNFILKIDFFFFVIIVRGKGRKLSKISLNLCLKISFCALKNSIKSHKTFAKKSTEIVESFHLSPQKKSGRFIGQK
jgi:hypothetical protein